MLIKSQSLLAQKFIMSIRSQSILSQRFIMSMRSQMYVGKIFNTVNKILGLIIYMYITYIEFFFFSANNICKQFWYHHNNYYITMGNGTFKKNVSVFSHT